MRKISRKLYTVKPTDIVSICKKCDRLLVNGRHGYEIKC